MNDSLTDVFHFGMVEDRHSDPLKLGRVRVRIVGLHTEDLTALPTLDLPLATVMLPSNMAAMGGTGYSPTGVIEGTWCVIIFADEYKQQPIIIGTIGGIPQPVVNADGSGTGATSNATVAEPCPADVKADTAPKNNDALPKLVDNITGCDKAGKDAIKDEEKCASTVPGIKRGQLPKWCKSTDPDSTPLYAYPDSGGVWTIGYGYTQGIVATSTSTKGEADKKFDAKLAPYEASTKRLVKVPLTQGQFNAVCSMVYNGGEGNIGNSAFLKELNAGRYESAAAMIPDTVNTVKGVKNQGLVNRRIREQKMFLSSGTPTYEGSTVIASSEATCPLNNVEEVYESAPGIPVKGGVIKSGQAAGVVQTSGGGSSGSSGNNEVIVVQSDANQTDKGGAELRKEWKLITTYDAPAGKVIYNNYKDNIKNGRLDDNGDGTYLFSLQPNGYGVNMRKLCIFLPPGTTKFFLSIILRTVHESSNYFVTANEADVKNYKESDRPYSNAPNKPGQSIQEYLDGKTWDLHYYPKADAQGTNNLNRADDFTTFDKNTLKTGVYLYFIINTEVWNLAYRVDKVIFDDWFDNAQFDADGNPLVESTSGSGSSGGSSNFYEGIHKGNLTSIHQFPRGLKDVKGFKNQYNEEYITQFSQGQPVTVLNMSPPSGALSASKIFIPKGTQQISLIGYYPQNTFGADGVLSTQYSAVYVLRYGSEPERNEPYTEEDLQKLFAGSMDPSGIASKMIETKEDTFVWHPNGGHITIISGSIPATTESNWLYILGLRGPTPEKWSGGIAVNNEAYLEEYKKIKWDKNGDPVDPYPISSDTSDKGKTESSSTNLYTNAKFEEKKNDLSFSANDKWARSNYTGDDKKAGFKQKFAPDVVTGNQLYNGVKEDPGYHPQQFTLFIPKGMSGLKILGNADSTQGTQLAAVEAGAQFFITASFGRDDFVPLLRDGDPIAETVRFPASISEIVEKGYSHMVYRWYGNLSFLAEGLVGNFKDEDLPMWLHVTIGTPSGMGFDSRVNVGLVTTSNYSPTYEAEFNKIIWSKLNPNEPAYPYPKGTSIGSGSNSTGQVSGSTGTMTSNFISNGVNRLIDNIVMAPITGQMTLDILMNDHGLTEKIAQKILDYTFDGNALADWETILSSPDPLGYAATFYDENKDNIKLGNILNSSGSTASSDDSDSGGSSGTSSGSTGVGTSGTIKSYNDYLVEVPYKAVHYSTADNNNTDSWEGLIGALLDDTLLPVENDFAKYKTLSFISNAGSKVSTSERIKIFVPPGALFFKLSFYGRSAGGTEETQYKIRLKGLEPGFNSNELAAGDNSDSPTDAMDLLSSLQSGEEYWFSTDSDAIDNSKGFGVTQNAEYSYTNKGVWVYLNIVSVPPPDCSLQTQITVHYDTFMKWFNNEHKFFDSNGWPLEGVVHSV